MTIYNTLEHFKNFIEGVVHNERLLTKKNKMKIPQVKLGYLDENEGDLE